MNKFGTIVSYHFQESVKAKSTFIIFGILFALTLGMFAFNHFNSGEAEKQNIVFINEGNHYMVNSEGLNKAVPSATFENGNVGDLSSLKDKVKEGELDGVILLEEQNEAPVITYVYNNLPSGEIKTLVNVHVQQQFINKTVTENNVAPQVAAKLFAQTEVKEEAITDTTSTFAFVYIFIFLMYLFIVIFGQVIATAITAEKSSRVMEIIIPKVKPIYMMYGKILATLLVAIIQLSGIVLGVVVAISLGWFDMDNLSLLGGALDLSAVTPLVGTAFIGYFILGYWLYAILYAALGSLVSRTEDLGTATVPAMMLMMAAFFIGINTSQDPSSTMAIVSSYVPFFSPLSGFARVVTGEMAGYEMGISFGILLVTIIVLNIVASRIYVNGVMYYSEKWQWKNLVRFMKKN